MVGSLFRTKTNGEQTEKSKNKLARMMLSSECYLIRDQIYKYHYTKEDRRCTVLFYLYYYSATVPDLLFTTRVLKEKLHTIINYTYAFGLVCWMWMFNYNYTS